MPILTLQGAPHSQCPGGDIWPYSRYINEKPRLRINPARVNHIQLIERSFGCETGIYFEEVVSALWDVREVVVEDGHVIVAGEKGEGVNSHLDVDV